MNRLRLGALLAVAAVVALAGSAGRARASAEEHRLNLVISAIPSAIAGGDFNDYLQFINRTELDPNGLKNLDRIGFGWEFGVELRYMVRPSFAVSAGVSQLRSVTSQEYLPGIGQSVTLRGEVLSVPVHVGGDYYFIPYNQGDFRARAFIGGGFLSLVYNKALYQQVVLGVDTSQVAVHDQSTGDAPGYYLETGVHMFFASSLSVLLAGYWRSAVVRNMVNADTGAPVYNTDGKPFALDLSGLGFRAAVARGF